MSRSFMPPSFLPAGVLDKGGRDKDGLFRDAERNPPAGTRLGMPLRGAVTNWRVTNPIQQMATFLFVSHFLPQTLHINLFHTLGNRFQLVIHLQPTKEYSKVLFFGANVK
jgi:hypothetical protein